MRSIFKKKSIAQLSVGEILRKQRQQKNVSLEAASAATKISVKYLAALENGDYRNLPDGIYARNFLREYCYFLGLDAKRLLNLFAEEASWEKIEEKDKPVFSHQRPRWHYFLSLPKVVRNIILVLVVLMGLGYLGWRVRQIIAPPSISISFPPENYITSEQKITLTGATEHEARITVNGSEVLSDESGHFSEEVNLTAGLNVITVKVKKRYGRETAVVRQVLVK